MNGLEIRSFAVPVSLVGDSNTVEGYAAKFNELSTPLGNFREVIEPGAFKRSLDAGQEIHLLLEHDPRFVLGCRSAGTLELVEDSIGLKIRCELPDTTYANDLKKSLARGDVRGMSFGFLTPQGGDRWEAPRGDDGLKTRVLKSVDLRECTITCRPVYPQTEVALRSMQQCEFRAQTISRLQVAKATMALKEIHKKK